jgi:hypothetical protein
LLGHCKGKSKIWIISRDRDYCTEYFEEVSLNPLLYRDLTQICQPTIEVFCFKNLGKGLDHFVKTTGVKADKLPSPEELQVIKERLFTWISPRSVHLPLPDSTGPAQGGSLLWEADKGIG